MDKLYGVILAGGRGERFWPMSKRERPKQLLPITGKKTMIEETFSRMASFIHKENIISIGTETIDEAIKDLKLFSEGNTLTEPFGRNTALAIGYAAVMIHHKDPGSVILVCPADHDIHTEKDFKATIMAGYDFALKDNIVTFGITPVRPEIGYGYIEIGEELVKDSVYRIKSFKEKPNLKVATSYIKSGNTLWNSGIFLWKTAVILDAIRKFLPDMAACLDEFSKHIGTDKEKSAMEKLYKDSPATSIDFGVMEQAENIVIVRAGFKWDDVGDWNALERIKNTDKSGNIMEGEVVEINSENNIMFSEDGLIAAVGVKDLVIVRTKDITLVCRQRDTNEIKALLKEIEKNNKLSKYL